MSNSNVPVICCNPDAVKDVTDEVRLMLTSPSTRCTPLGTARVVIATLVTIILPVTVEQPASASRSLCDFIVKPLGLAHELPWPNN